MDGRKLRSGAVAFTIAWVAANTVAAAENARGVAIDVDYDRADGVMFATGPASAPVATPETSFTIYESRGGGAVVFGPVFRIVRLDE